MGVSNKHSAGQKKPGTEDYICHLYVAQNEGKTISGEL